MALNPNHPGVTIQELTSSSFDIWERRYFFLYDVTCSSRSWFPQSIIPLGPNALWSPVLHIEQTQVSVEQGVCDIHAGSSFHCKIQAHISIWQHALLYKGWDEIQRAMFSKRFNGTNKVKLPFKLCSSMDTKTMTWLIVHMSANII